MAASMLPVRIFAICMFMMHAQGLFEVDRTFDCFENRCTIGVHFCETEKEICRMCEHFKESCWQHNRHIANCSDYCKAEVQNGTCKNESGFDEMVIYICGGVMISLLAISFFCNIWIYVMCKKTKEKENTLSSKDNLTNMEDETKLLIVKEEKKKNSVVHLSLKRKHVPEVKKNDSQPNGFIPPNQVPVTNDRGDQSKIVVTGKQLTPRDGIPAGDCL